MPRPAGGGWPPSALPAGITAGTVLALAGLTRGWLPAVGGLPAPAGLAAGLVVAWLALVAFCVLAAGLLARHHRSLARAAGRGAARAGVAAARAAGAGTRHLASRAGPRWDARPRQPLLITRARRDPGTPGGTGTEGPGPPPGSPPAASAAAVPGPAVPAPPPPSRQPAVVRAVRLPDPVPGTPAGPFLQGGSVMTSPLTISSSPRGPAGPPARGAPGGWTALVADTSDFEPDDDAELLDWMAGQVAGMAAYAEALTEVYETCVHSLGVDPAAMNAVHDTADAAADAATAMAYARQKFAGHYAEVREFAAAGGVLPFNGRWITGDGTT